MASAKLTRLVLLKEIRTRYPKVAVRQTVEFKQAISETLEYLFHDERKNLTEDNGRIFDKEVQHFYAMIPLYWNSKRISRHMYCKIFRYQTVALSVSILIILRRHF